MSLAAYDRMFPNQDSVMPGGWGNLIALPLAKVPRMAGNTVFLDETLNPIADQWDHLARVQRLTLEPLDALLGKISPISNLAMEASTDGPDLVLQSEDEILQLSSQRVVHGVLNGDVTVRLDSKVHIPRDSRSHPSSFATARVVSESGVSRKAPPSLCHVRRPPVPVRGRMAPGSACAAKRCF
jgi:hypothetical protein